MFDTLSQWNRYTDFNEIWDVAYMILEEGHKELFIAATDIRTDGINYK